MKGYAEVSCTKAMSARYNYINWVEQTEALIFDELIPKYYAQEYPKQNFLLRWWYKDKTPEQFLRAKSEFLSPFSEQLFLVATAQELKVTDLWERSYSTNQKSKAIRQLCAASTKGKISVDNELAGFIEEWGVK